MEIIYEVKVQCSHSQHLQGYKFLSIQDFNQRESQSEVFILFECSLKIRISVTPLFEKKTEIESYTKEPLGWLVSSFYYPYNARKKEKSDCDHKES